MIKLYIYSLIVLSSLSTAICQDFGKVLFYSGVGINLPFGEVGTKDFKKPGGMANLGFKSDILFFEYQFKNGFGIGLKSSIAINSVDNKRIEEFMISNGAESANARVKPWVYGELSLQGLRSLFQTHHQLLVLMLGIGQAIVNKPEEYYSATFSDGSENIYSDYASYFKNTIVGNTGLSYWLKIGRHFCIVSTIDYSHIPFRASFNTMSENARKLLYRNLASDYTPIRDQSTSRPFTIYGLSAGIKLGFSF